MHDLTPVILNNVLNSGGKKALFLFLFFYWGKPLKAKAPDYVNDQHTLVAIRNYFTIW